MVEQTRTYGRGGAGNFEFGRSENQLEAERKRTQDERSREKLKQAIEKGVQEQLAMPQKAKLAGAEPYELA